MADLMSLEPMHDSMLPTFLIIGAGKSGTTSLWSYLGQHPQIGMSAIKEPSFFSFDHVYNRGLKWYRNLFCNHTHVPVRGEASNSYSATQTWPKTIERVAATLHDPKFIYLVRHPRERTESDFMQMRKAKSVSFSDFLRTDSVHADKNMYLRTFENYTATFGEKSMLVLLYDDLRARPKELLSAVCEFLNVDPSYEFDYKRQHGQSSQGRRFLPGFRRFRETKAYVDLSLRVPAVVKGTLRNAISQTFELDRPVWSVEDIAWFRERYEKPTRVFLDTVNLDPGAWSWADGWRTSS